MELREALTHIEEIRLRLARTEVFRGYRALPVALSGVLAGAAALLQPGVAPEPTKHLDRWLLLWIGVAGLSVLTTAAVILARERFFASSAARAVTRLAIVQFVPCLAAGALLTFVLVRSAPASAWMLPGLWQVLFSQGVFASCRLLPRPFLMVGCFYLCAGLLGLAFGQDEQALAPWVMGLPFAIGQLGTAALLYWTLERHDQP
jgi:hypothetical protein